MNSLWDLSFPTSLEWDDSFFELPLTCLNETGDPSPQLFDSGNVDWAFPFKNEAQPLSTESGWIPDWTPLSPATAVWSGYDISNNPSFNQIFPDTEYTESTVQLSMPQIYATPAGPVELQTCFTPSPQEEIFPPPNQKLTPPTSLAFPHPRPGRPRKGIRRTRITKRLLQKLHNESARSSRTRINKAIEKLWNNLPEEAKDLGVAGRGETRRGASRALKLEMVFIDHQRLKKLVREAARPTNGTNSA